MYYNYFQVSSLDSNVNVSSELFTDLDPLGSGRSRPYVDKKDFFSELKSSSPKLGNMSSTESPVPMTLSSSMEATTTNVGLTEVSLSCPVSQQPSMSSTSQFVHNTNQRSSLRGPGNQPGPGPTPPPRSGSELTYGHLGESSRRSFTSSDTMPRHVRGFGFSSHLSQPSTASSSAAASCTVTSSVLSTSSSMSSRTTNPSTSITSWRSQSSGNHLQDTRLYHTLGRPMTTFNRSQMMEMDDSSSSLAISSKAPDNKPLRVSMLPENSLGPTTDEPLQIENIEDSNRYGSIPQLEASPRRYNRLKDPNEFSYDTSGSSLSVPTRTSSQPTDSPNDLPPKLPEKPSRRTNQLSPPPLPPKKPITKGLKGIVSYGRPQPCPSLDTMEHQAPPDVVSGHEIYDFPPMPMLGSLKMDKEEAKQCMRDILKSDKTQLPEDESATDTKLPVSVEDLSKMSLIDLNNKMTSGQLPEQMKGMSILELVDFINEEVKRKAARQKQSQPTQMKMSFSDNFVCDNLPKTNDEPPAAAPPPAPFAAAIPADEMSNASNQPGSPGPLSGSVTSKEVGFAFQSQDGSGFDDDFASFSINSHMEKHGESSIARPESQATSDHSVLSQSKPDEYDKYAVFRELQMEEELIKAWKTPSDEENVFEEKVLEEVTEEEVNIESNEPTTVATADQEPYNSQPVCSSEGSPCSRSDTQSPGVKSYPTNNDQNYEEEPNVSHINNSIPNDKEGEEAEDVPQETQLGNKRESQVPIFHQNDDFEEEVEEESVTQFVKSPEHHDFNQPEITSNNGISESGLDELHPSSGGHEFNHEQSWNDTPETVEMAQQEESLFSNTFESAAQASTSWTTFDDGPDEADSAIYGTIKQTSISVVANYSSVQEPSAFQDNFGDPIDWSTVDEVETSQGHLNEVQSQGHVDEVTSQSITDEVQTQDHEHHPHQEGNLNQYQHQQHEEELKKKSKALPARQLSSESQNSVGKCKRFSHRHVDADHICQHHSFETSEDANATSNAIDTYNATDWWPPSAVGAPHQDLNINVLSTVSNQSVPANQRKRQISGTGNEAYTSTPDHKPGNNQENHSKTSSNNSGWSEDAFAEPLEARFKIFSKVINANNGMDPRSMTPHSDPISDSDSGIIPKSDSVNIFSIKDDPFDDDFFL